MNTLWSSAYRTGVLIGLAALLLIVTSFFVFSRPAEARASGGDIAHNVFCFLDGLGSPTNVFDEQGCADNGGHVAQCNDGIDNDGDGKVDYPADPGCSSASDDDETDSVIPPINPQCSDGIDNDGDGKIDWGVPGDPNRDPGCTTPTDNDETDTVIPPAAQCADGIDNDADGLIDMADPGCSSASDDTESPDPSTNNGGGSTSGGGSSHHRSGSSSGGGLVLGTTTAAIACDQYLTAFIRMGHNNDMGQVARLQYVLKEFEGAAITINGVYDVATLAAVNAFQLKYASEILTPWGINAPTGYVYLTTRKKIDEVYCRDTQQFPLTPEQIRQIQSVREGGASSYAPVSTWQTPAPASTATPAIELPKGSHDSASVPPSATDDTSPPSGGWWGNIVNFFGGLF